MSVTIPRSGDTWPMAFYFPFGTNRKFMVLGVPVYWGNADCKYVQTVLNIPNS